MDVRQRTREVARDVVRTMAPEEMPLFDATCAAWFASGRRARAGRRRKDDMLGLGVDAVVPLVTTAALTAVGAALQLVAEETGAWWGRRLVRRLRRRRSTTAAGSPGAAQVQPSSLRQVRDAAHRAATDLGLPDDKAAMLADLVADAFANRPS